MTSTTAPKRLFLALLILSVSSAVILAQEPAEQIKVGDSIGAFNANDDQGNLWTSSEHMPSGKYLVVYFYPAAMTGGCTAQACAYRDTAAELAAVNANVIGVSGDSVNNLKIFKQAHHLNFPLLSDVTASIAKEFGVPARKGGTFKTTVDGKEVELKRAYSTSRWTFILDDQGKVIFKNTQVNAGQDSANVIEFLKSKRP